MKCVILAGGSGTRFWPYSRHHHPKQLLNIIGDTSMLQMTVDRLKKIKKITDIYIITRKNLYDLIIQNIKGIKPDHVIVEPSGKNTAPAIGMMAARISLQEATDRISLYRGYQIILIFTVLNGLHQIFVSLSIMYTTGHSQILGWDQECGLLIKIFILF